MSHWTEEMFIEDADVFRPSLEDRTETADEEVDQLLDLVGDHGVDPETALDVACGIGRHAVELADRGVAVTGVDISEPYVERARERAADRGVADRTDLRVGDMRGLPVEGPFDLATNMWTSFGYYDDETNRAVAADVRERVASGGAFVVEMANREGMLANYHPSGTHEAAGYLHTERREYDPETGRMETTMQVFEATDDDGNAGEEAAGEGDATDETDGADGYEYLGEVAWDVRTYTPVELRRLLERAGFDAVSLYASLDGDELDRESTRLVAVAEP